MNKIPAFIALDLETTGLDYEKDEIIEVALVRFENGVPTESVDYLVKPIEAKLRPFIESLTGISQADVDQAEDFASVAGKIVSFIGDLPVVAHNVTFDSKFLRQTLLKVGISFEDHVFWDSLTLSRIAYQDVPNHRLDTLVQILNIERSRAHRALPDADACGKLFVMAYEKISQMDAWLVDALTHVSAGTSWEGLFGKSESPLPMIPALSLPEVSTEPQALPRTRAPRVTEFFKEDGLLAKQIPDFKHRADQEDFASVVERNIHKGGLCVLEAPTGSGKTLSYLVAAANKAVSGERVVISTATRALQKQLWNHDIPQISSLYDGNLKPAILKGRDNYLCLRKLEQVLNAPQGLISSEERDSLMALIPWVLKTENGDINECPSFNHGRNRVLWSKLSSNAASCLGENCRYFGKCPALCAKRRAVASNMLLVNHSLFLADLSLDFALLPSYEHIVFDEAHRLPEVSSQCSGRTVSFFSFRNVAKTLVPSKNVRDGLLAEIENRLPEEAASLRDGCEQLINELNETEKSLHRFFMKIGKKLGKQKMGKDSLVYTKGIMAEYESDPKPVMDQFENARDCANKLLPALLAIPSVDGLAKDVSGRMEELSRFASDFEFLVRAGREGWIFYLEEPFNPHTLKMHAYPLQAGSLWKEKFYPWIKSATFTSATLSVQGDLEYYVQKMSMPGENSFKKPFLRVYRDDSDHGARRSVMVTRNLPKPSVPEFGGALNEALLNILPDVEENVLVLFTSIAMMMKAQKELAPAFAAKGKLLLCQHVDGSLDGLTAMFRKSRGACLLGCQTLWEGVDFPGDALKVLVITKLPFPNPADPIVAGISAQMKSKGENAFKNYFVPEAYMELRQGLGRLLRSENDSGKVLIMDNRIVTEPYGKSFARIWNGKHQIADSLDDVKKFLL